jgi:hypothetical protein
MWRKQKVRPPGLRNSRGGPGEWTVRLKCGAPEECPPILAQYSHFLLQRLSFVRAKEWRELPSKRDRQSFAVAWNKCDGVCSKKRRESSRDRQKIFSKLLALLRVPRALPSKIIFGGLHSIVTVEVVVAAAAVDSSTYSIILMCVLE